MGGGSTFRNQTHPKGDSRGPTGAGCDVPEQPSGGTVCLAGTGGNATANTPKQAVLSPCRTRPEGAGADADAEGGTCGSGRPFADFGRPLPEVSVRMVEQAERDGHWPRCLFIPISKADFTHRLFAAFGGKLLAGSSGRRREEPASLTPPKTARNRYISDVRSQPLSATLSGMRDDSERLEPSLPYRFRVVRVFRGYSNRWFWEGVRLLTNASAAGDGHTPCPLLLIARV